MGEGVLLAVVSMWRGGKGTAQFTYGLICVGPAIMSYLKKLILLSLVRANYPCKI